MNIDDDDSHSKTSSSCSLESLIASLSSSLSKLSSSSRAIPYDKDFHFFANFNEFKGPIEQITSHSQFLLEIVGSSSSRVFDNSKKTLEFPSKDQDFDTEAYDWLVDFNDEVLERLDVSIDEFKRMREKQEEKGRLGADDSGFQLVYGKKNKKKMKRREGEGVMSGEEEEESKLVTTPGVKVAEKAKDSKRPKVPFHIPTLRRPQDEHNILVNNSNQPFEHVWLERSEDGTRVIHPLEKCSVLDFVDQDIADVEPVPPPPIDSTPFKLVEEVRDLKELAAKLRSVKEIAVDLEHNQYRSFQGLTCLMQISTRTEDFIVDTFKLRIHIGPYLREIFKDPAKKKVMHGADRDVVWLQRDFGIYLCNMFDTGQASKVLKLERNSLEYLLQHFCGVTANKEYQNADWRLRPLPDKMVRYAREDTHYLLHVYDLMKIKLHSLPKESEHSDTPLVEVYKRSYDVCMQFYEKELFTENSYLHIYGLQGAGFNAQQLAIVSGLFEWRDIMARSVDESTGYIMPNKVLLEIAKQKPVTTGKLQRLLKSKHPYVDRHLGTIVEIIRNSMRNAAEFEVAVQQLKEGHTGTAAEENEVVSPATPNNSRTLSARMQSVVGGNTINGSLRTHLPASPLFKQDSSGHGSTIAELARDGEGGSLHLPGTANRKEKIESDSHTLELFRESLNISGQSRDTKSGMGLSPSAKVTGATVQVLKKPSHAFGSLLGNAGPKRMSDTDKKDKEQIKLEQIRSSVNLPFRSFPDQTEQSKAVVEEPARVLQVSQPEQPPPLLAVRSNAEDVIMLDDGSDAEVTARGSTETTNTSREDKDEGPALKLDKEDEPMSLDDLSTSFERSFQSLNENRKTNNAKKSQEPAPILQVKPFDYEAARKEARFGEEPKQESVAKGAENESGSLNSGVLKKSATVGKGPGDDMSREFAPGKRRLAFPATGNRSATFR